MGRLVTICPATGHLIETGVESDQHSMEHTPHFRMQVSCVYCQCDHLIAKEDCMVCEMVDGVLSYQSAA